MIEGQPSWKERQPDVNPLAYEIASLEARVIELEGNYSKKYDAQIFALKRRILNKNNELKNGSSSNNLAA